MLRSACIEGSGIFWDDPNNILFQIPAARGHPDLPGDERAPVPAHLSARSHLIAEPVELGGKRLRERLKPAARPDTVVVGEYHIACSFVQFEVRFKGSRGGPRPNFPRSPGGFSPLRGRPVSGIEQDRIARCRVPK